MGLFENKIVSIIEEIIGSKAMRQKTFDWLLNTHIRVENLQAMETLDHVFMILCGDKNKLLMKRVIKLRVDAYFENENMAIEIDEIQHFTEFRLKALDIISTHNEIKLGYNLGEYINYCQENYMRAIQKGQSGYRSSKPEFPFEFGRAYQRAYFDTIRDVLFPLHMNKPIIRISELEIMHMDNVEVIKKYLENKLKKYV